jgi:hypothetical protein
VIGTYMSNYLKILLVVGISTVLMACGPSAAEKYADQLKTANRIVNQSVDDLAYHLGQSRIPNALILNSYADSISTNNPEMRGLANALKVNGTVKGPAYQSLVTRLSETKKVADGFAAIKGDVKAQFFDQAGELNAINTAAAPGNFNLMLSDPINVLAGLSNGKLSKVEDGVEGEAPKGTTPGSELVGNPNYGRWNENSSGSSFWAFYGQYAFMSRLFSSPVSYGRWSDNRTPSYYSDRGRAHYTSKQQATNSNNAFTRERKNFQSKGKTFSSPYSKNTTLKSSIKSPSKFQSSYNSNTRSSNSSYGNRPTSNKSAFSSSYGSRSGSSSSRSYSSGGK